MHVIDGKPFASGIEIHPKLPDPATRQDEAIYDCLRVTFARAVDDGGGGGLVKNNSVRFGLPSPFIVQRAVTRWLIAASEDGNLVGAFPLKVCMPSTAP